MERSQQIREARERLGMSQETLAERVGVSRQAVSKWQMGSSEPSLENLKNLSDVLNIDLSSREAIPPPNRRKAAAYICMVLLLLSFTGLALLWTSMKKNGWPPKEPRLTGVYFI